MTERTRIMVCGESRLADDIRRLCLEDQFNVEFVGSNLEVDKIRGMEIAGIGYDETEDLRKFDRPIRLENLEMRRMISRERQGWSDVNNRHARRKNKAMGRRGTK